MNLSDTWNFIKKLTALKIFNAIGVYYSYRKAQTAKNTSLPYLPFTLSIEPTTACNLRCPECPSGLRSFTRPTGNLKYALFEEIIHQVKNKLIYLIFYFQGEPYIHPGFLKMVRHASKQKIYTITSTNGHFLNDENARLTVASGLDRLIISIDGTTQEVYEKYRQGGNLENVIQGAKNVIKWKKKLKTSTPHLIFQFLVVKPNEHQMEDVKKLAKKIGIDEVKYKTAQIYDYKNGSPLIPSDQKYSRYKNNGDGTYGLKFPIKNECWKMWHSAVITWDGKIVPCCFDKDTNHIMGSLKTQSLHEIWNGEKYQAFRAALFNDRPSIDICTNCSEGLKVWA